MTSETHFHSECFVANIASVGVATSDFGWNKICVTANWDHPYIMSAERPGGWVKKIAVFIDIQYCIYADIVSGWDTVRNRLPKPSAEAIFFQPSA